MAYLWNPTLASDINYFSEQQIAYIDGARAAAAQLPFLRSRPANAMNTKYIPNHMPSTYQQKQGAGPSPRQLSKGRTVTATELRLENSTVLDRKAQMAMLMGGNDANEILRAMGTAYIWTLHIHGIDLLMNDAFSTNWQDEGVPFYSASHPTNYGATQSNRLESAFDMAAFKLACVMLDKTLGYDGSYQSRRPGYVLVASDAGPDTTEIINGIIRVPVPGTVAATPQGYGYQGASFIGSSGLQGAVSSPVIEDSDAWALLSDEFALEVLVVDPPMPKREPLPGTRDEIISDEAIVQLLVKSWRDAIGGGPA